MTSAQALSGSPAAEPDILGEIKTFSDQCEVRFRFNNKWDVLLITGGILLGVGVVAAGVYNEAKLASILGAFITAVISVQRAFPFGQRAQFYRALMGQAANLMTDVNHNLTTEAVAANTLKSLRLDFAQQLPRGGAAGAEKPPESPVGGAPVGGAPVGGAPVGGAPVVDGPSTT